MRNAGVEETEEEEKEQGSEQDTEKYKSKETEPGF